MKAYTRRPGHDYHKTTRYVIRGIAWTAEQEAQAAQEQQRPATRALHFDKYGQRIQLTPSQEKQHGPQIY